MKTIVMKTKGGSNNATMTTAGGNLLAGQVSTSIVWNSEGDAVTLMYNWYKVGSCNLTLVQRYHKE